MPDIEIILAGPGGELDRIRRTVTGHEHGVTEALERWLRNDRPIIATGDTIAISEPTGGNDGR